VIGGADGATREHLIRTHLDGRRAATDAEVSRLREEIEALGRREAVLREEVALLDAILEAIPAPPKESEAPSLFAPSPRPAPPTTPVSVVRKRRRKGSRREQMLPVLKEKFGAEAFRVEDVTDLVLEAQGGERRAAYFAAYSLVQDLAEDGAITVASEEGTGMRKKRTYRFPIGSSPAPRPR